MKPTALVACLAFVLLLVPRAARAGDEEPDLRLVPLRVVESARASARGRIVAGKAVSGIAIALTVVSVVLGTVSVTTRGENDLLLPGVMQASAGAFAATGLVGAAVGIPWWATGARDNF